MYSSIILDNRALTDSREIARRCDERSHDTEYHVNHDLTTVSFTIVGKADNGHRGWMLIDAGNFETPTAVCWQQLPVPGKVRVELE